MYIRVVPAFMFMNCIHAEHPQRSEEVLRLPWTALKDSLGATAGNSTQVLCSREQYVILTTVQSISQVPPQHLKTLSPTENSMLQRARPCGTFLIQIITFTKSRGSFSVTKASSLVKKTHQSCLLFSSERNSLLTTK